MLFQMLPAAPGHDVLADVLAAACDDVKSGPAPTPYQQAVVTCCGEALLALLVARGPRFGAEVTRLVSSPAFSRDSPVRHKQVVGTFLAPSLHQILNLLDAFLVSVPPRLTASLPSHSLCVPPLVRSLCDRGICTIF